MSDSLVINLTTDCEINSSHCKINNEQTHNVREYNVNSCNNGSDVVLVLSNTQRHDANENIIIDSMIYSIIEEQVSS